MLKEIKDAGWAPTGVWLWRRWLFVAGNISASRPVKARLLNRMAAVQETGAVAVLARQDRTYWWCMDRCFWEDDGLADDDVFALVYERQLRARRRLDHAHATVALGLTEPAARREPIGRDARLAVWERDGGRCVQCGSGFEIQYDHIIPVVMGGATSVANLQILCGGCNRRKGATLG